MEVEWNKIKNGFRGFEKLAKDFVQDQYSNVNWKATRETRDGNKDAIALIFGFHSENQKQEWWMEAKYSEANKMLSRYRVDATIVSAILKSTVSRIIFVTNIIISAKTITDIRMVLKKSLKCEQVEFYSRYSLEYWLASTSGLYRKYFHVSEEDEANLDMPNMFVIQELEYFSTSASHSIFKEPMRELFFDKRYDAYCILYSPHSCNVEIKPSSHIKGVKLLSSHYVNLHSGENIIKFSFKIKDNYGIKYGYSERIPAISFKIGEVEISSSTVLIPKATQLTHMDFNYQRKLLKNILTSINQFSNNQEPFVGLVTGISGSGKSYVLNQLISDENLEDYIIYYRSFSNNVAYNYKLLIHLILFLLFPYISPETIDARYLDEIDKFYIDKSFIDLLRSIDNFEKFSSLLSNYPFQYNLLPDQISINPRLIILDDAQKLNTIGTRFLFSILVEISQKNLPVFTIVGTQPVLLQDQSFYLIREQCNTYNLFECELDMNEIISYITNPEKECVSLNGNIFRSFTSNVIELFFFLKYLMINQTSIQSIEDLIFHYRLFQRCAIIEQHIIKQFKNLFDINPEYRTICDRIYWSCNPFKHDKKWDKAISRLIDLGLVSYNDENFIVPFHDLYKEHYKKYFKPVDVKCMGYETNSAEYLKYEIEQEYNRQHMMEIVHKLDNLMEKKYFHTVLYILQDLFEYTNKTILKNRMGDIVYYSLYLDYALAAHQQTLNISCIDLFEELYNETNFRTNAELIEIHMISTWELAIIAFENLQYKKVQKLLQEVCEEIKKIQELKCIDINIKNNIYYHRVAGQKMLVCADQGDDVTEKYATIISDFKKYSFDYLCQSYGARYAVTLCVHNPKQCIELLDKGRKTILKCYGNEDKHYLWCEFYYYFYNLIWNKQDYYLEQMLFYHEKMKKNQYGNYRKKLYAIACYFYSKNDIVNGDKYLLKDSIFQIKLRSRYEGFYQVAISLREALNGNYNIALEALRKSSAIFKELPEYDRVINHDIILISENKFNKKNICFWFGQEMKSDVFYLDPRSAW